MAVDDPDPPQDADETILGVVLAAGRSSRFDAPTKLVEPLGGRPLVVHATETLAEADAVDDVVVVTGHADAAVTDAIDASPLDVAVRHNPDFDTGQSTSVATGARLARERDADAVVFALGDMPTVDATTVDALVDASRSAERAGGPGIVVPEHDGRRGNPVCFDRRHYDDLAALPADQSTRDDPTDPGARTLFERYPVERVAVDDPGIHLDVDTPADLDAIRARLANR